MSQLQKIKFPRRRGGKRTEQVVHVSGQIECRVDASGRCTVFNKSRTKQMVFGKVEGEMIVQHEAIKIDPRSRGVLHFHLKDGNLQDRYGYNHIG